MRNVIDEKFAGAFGLFRCDNCQVLGWTIQSAPSPEQKKMFDRAEGNFSVFLFVFFLLAFVLKYL